MPRMFDMLRGGGDDEMKKKRDEAFGKEAPKNKKPQDPRSVNFPKEIIRKSEKSIKKPEDHSLMSKKLISAVKKNGVDNQEVARGIYKSAIDTIKALLSKIRNRENINPLMIDIYALLDKIFNQLLLGDNILNDIYEEKEDEYFLPYHIVNMLILSFFLGINMGFNKSKLKNLSVASIFCDAGMDGMQEMIAQPRKLTDEEFEMIKTHVHKSLEIVEKIDSVGDIVKEIIGMHHERANGSGYPKGLKSDEINAYAKIIGLVDTYEAMTHNRAYRGGMSAHKTLKVLINTLKDNFDYDAIKLLIDKMSIFPIGSIVRLDNEEIARVISVIPGSPLRPVIMILKDAFGQSSRNRTVIDLSKVNSPSILSPI
ncbi:MAG: HD domain-containing protein [Candidatus Omnitrophica bacterium]|nr:HD domain-containing protein [Candidatus Omnitrophota bacterium]